MSGAPANRHGPPLHVCFVSQEYPPETGWGGLGSYTYEMAHGLARAGHRVSVIARSADREQVSNDHGVIVHRVAPAPRWDRLRGLWRLNKIWPGFAWAAMLRLREIHRHSPIDILEAGENRADSFFSHFLRNGPPSVVRLHTAWKLVDMINRVQPDAKKRFIYWQEKRVIATADLVTSPSNGMVHLTDSWISLKGKSVHVVPNPVDTHTFAPGHGIRASREVLFAGRLELRKGANTLVAALPLILKECPDATFRFVGADGIDEQGRSWRERLKESVAPPQLGQLCFEQAARHETIQLYQHSSVCVLPSIWENFPYVLLEAMSCGAPVVATRVGGIPEIVADGDSGVLVPPDDPAAFAGAVVSLLRDGAAREKMGHNARHRVQTAFDTNVVVPRMVDVYRSLLRNGEAKH